jgi:hypothetical protein
MLLIPGNSSSQSETRKRIMLLMSTRITCRSERQLIQSKDGEFQVREIRLSGQGSAGSRGHTGDSRAELRSSGEQQRATGGWKESAAESREESTRSKVPRYIRSQDR